MPHAVARATAIGVAVLLSTACPWAHAQLPPASSAASAAAPMPPIPPPPPAPPPPFDVAPRIDSSSRVAPVYPGFEAIYGIGGRVVLDIAINNQGAVIDVRVERSSGVLVLDRAAIVAARQWRFVPGERAGRPSGGVVRAPINFDPQPQGRDLHNELWPTAYAHPRYVADPSPIVYPTVDAAYAQLPALPHRPLAQAHPIEQLLVTDATGKLVEWWIFTDLRTPDEMATRMRFGGTPTDPVVEVSSLCTRAFLCTERSVTVLHGPVYARSP